MVKSASSVAKSDLVIDSVVIEPYATRLPKPRRTGDAALDGQKQLVRAAQLKLISLLMQNEELAFSTLAHAQAT
eukprot:9562600-Lingulodinium_polyedra.AAC.1